MKLRNGEATWSVGASGEWMGGVGLYGRPPCLLVDVAEAGDHKGPPRTAPPPSPLRMLMGFSLTSCLLGTVNRPLRPICSAFANRERAVDCQQTILTPQEWIRRAALSFELGRHGTSIARCARS